MYINSLEDPLGAQACCFQWQAGDVHIVFIRRLMELATKKLASSKLN